MICLFFKGANIALMKLTIKSYLCKKRGLQTAFSNLLLFHTQAKRAQGLNQAQAQARNLSNRVEICLLSIRKNKKKSGKMELLNSPSGIVIVT